MFDKSLNFIKKFKRNLFPFYKNEELRFVFNELQKGFPIDIVTARFVGGCVRKYLSNTEIDDIDIATTLSTDEIKERFKNSNFKVIETGTKHGTITLVSEKFKLELTTLRKDVKTDGRHAEVEYIDNWQLDSERRDFTINSIYLDIKGKVGERIREGFKIAIVGPTNAGKSSLLNYLSRRDIAIVSEIAGTTRDVIEAHLNIDGYPVIISDTAGIRDSKDEIEEKGIKLAFKSAKNADLIIVVIEPKSVDFTPFLKDLESKKAILVVNKMELNLSSISDEINKFNPIFISIKEEKNLENLISLIKENLKSKFISSEDIFITRNRHRVSLEKCIEHIENFERKKSIKDFDQGSEDLRLATRNLGMIVGKVDVEEVLGSIFNDFCIGK